MLKIKDNVNFKELLKGDKEFTIATIPEGGFVKLYLRINNLKDSLENRYYEYLEIDEATRIITGRLDCPVRGLSWKTSQLKLDHIPVKIINLVEEVSD